jgi:NAD(P)-dependent dehydrogenase (short-subunit alcohol dehydrogenase family)
VIEEAVAETGRVDEHIDTAGLWVEGPSETMTEADWDRVVNVNLKGTFFCCAYAIPELKKTEGCIVNLSSDAGVVGTPETAIYTASKGGVSLLTKSLALELAAALVRVNAVCPADVMTPMLEGQARDFGGGDPEGYFKRLLTGYPQGDKARFIKPEEVAELIFYLASPAAAPITGANISIDFGTTAGYGYA